MDAPPRNDEWMPLATQQLRLRHLYRIIGLNILCRDRCKLYFTLHHKLDCPPFYKSANVQHCSNSEVILWDTISCPDIIKSNSRTVCVRVWEHCSSNTLDEQDIVLFSWRVWFSGLVLTGSCNDEKFCPNTLIFQMNMNCFSSPEYLSTFSLENNDYLYDNLYENDHNAIKIHVSEQRDDISGSREATRSDSSPNSKSKMLDTSSDAYGIRRIAVRRLKTSIRQSYNLDKLLRIQKIQRSCKRLKQDIQQLSDEIMNQDLRRRSNVSKGRTIDYLLLDFDQTTPKAKMESKELRKKIELLRFKCSLLEREREQCNIRTEELSNQLRNKREARNNCCVSLRENNARLADDKSILLKRIKVILSDVKTKKDLELKINKRLSLLCSELKHIYPINKNPNGCFTVSNIPFPDKDYLSSNLLQTDNMKLMTPAALSVTLGFVAHLVQITSIILDKPLRFPLQCKPTIPSKQILYGIYLLNQNIAQLNYDMFELRLDPRATIENFLKLFCNIVKLGEDDHVDGQISILDDANRIDSFPKTKPSIEASSTQIERMRLRAPLAVEEKRYHSEDDLKTLAERCLKLSYSHERLDKQ